MSTYDGFNDKTIVVEKLGKSILKVFFDPAVYDVSYVELLLFTDQIARQIAWSVRFVSDEEDFERGIMTFECNPARQPGNYYLDDYASKVEEFLKHHLLAHATL